MKVRKSLSLFMSSIIIIANFNNVFANNDIEGEVSELSNGNGSISETRDDITSDSSVQYISKLMANDENNIAYPVTGGNIYFEQETGTIVSADKTITNADIPEKINNVNVEKIADRAFSQCTSLTSVNIPKKVNNIGYEAFADCTNLISVTLNENNVAESKLTIGSGAFRNCASLTKLVLPQKTRSIVLGVEFIGGTKISEFTVTKNVIDSDYYHPSGAFSKADFLTNVVFENGIEKVPHYILSGGNDGNKINTVTLPNTITEIDGYAFYNCPNLSEIILPDSLLSIGNCAFEKCSNLKKINIPKKVSNISYSAFADCTSLEEVVLNDNDVTGSKLTFGDNVFKNCNGITQINLPKKTRAVALGHHFIAGTSISEFFVTKNVVEGSAVYKYSGYGLPGAGAFAGAEKLKTITFEDGIEEVPNYLVGAYDDAVYVSKVVIPDSVKKIGVSAFYNCDDLEKVELPDSLQSIDDFAFSNCSKLPTINLPKNVSNIGWSAFSDCEELSSVIFNDNDTTDFKLSIGGEAFENDVCLTELNLPTNTYSIALGYRIISGTGIENFTITKNVIEGNAYDGEGVLAGANELKKVIFEDGIEKIPNSILASSKSTSRVKEVVIPDTINEIGEYAFYNCINLLKVDIPENVNNIKYSAFKNCKKLATIKIPQKVSEIGSDAFMGCEELTVVEFSDNNTPYFNLHIADSAFENCVALKQLNLPSGTYSITLGGKIIAGTGIEEIIITKNVKELNRSYDYGGILSGANELKKVTFESGLKKIPGHILDQRDKSANIKEVIIPNTIIEIGYRSFRNCTGISTIDIGNFVRRIDNDAFQNCEGLTNIKLSPTLKEISSGAFYGCSGLLNVEIPNSLKNIEENTFKNCSVMKSIKIPSSVINIKDSAFDGCNEKVVFYVVEESTAGKWAKEHGYTVSNYNDETVSNELEYAVYNGYIYLNKEKGSLVAADLSVSNVKIPGSVNNLSITKIDDDSFRNCEYLDTIGIPDSVKTIGNSAFRNCKSLKSIFAIAPSDTVNLLSSETYKATIPDTISYIGERAFENCISLSEVKISESVSSINDYTFKNCTSLNKIAIPDSLNLISENAFEGCSSELIFEAVKDSYAAKWAENHGYKVFYFSDNTIVLGDVNGDGNITTKDAVLALQMSTGKREQNTIADVNKDGSVTTKDAVLILRYSTGKIKTF